MHTLTSEIPDARLQRLIASVLPSAEIVRVIDLKPDTSTGTTTSKDAGYGAPLRIELRDSGRILSLVLHSATQNQFGHELRADRARDMLLAADTFGLLPQHTRVLDVGAYSKTGFVSLRETGEFYLLTEYAEGQRYAEDLRRIAETKALTPGDFARLDALVNYLVSTHAIKLPEPTLYQRSIRQLLGGGEGIFGIIDGYPERAEGVSRAQLKRIEFACLNWRWQLKRDYRRLVRIHGDFHPFNVLFDERSQLSLLDASRGSAGDAADDVSAMAINFIFFALQAPLSWGAAFQLLWQRFWAGYLERSKDAELLAVVPPFLAWRGLVLANPIWYPHVDAATRARLLDFIEMTACASSFDPESAAALFAC